MFVSATSFSLRSTNTGAAEQKNFKERSGSKKALRRSNGILP